MAVVAISPVGGSGQQFFDNNGAMLSGGLLYTYAAGTTTPQTSYTDSAGATPAANPIVLDASGRIGNGAWLVSGSLYKLALKTSANVTLGTWDNVAGYGATTAQATAITASTNTIAAIAGTNASATSSQSAVSIGLSTYNRLPFDTKVYDPGVNFNTILSRFIAPAAGLYLATAACQMAKLTPVVGEYCLLAAYKNGVLALSGASSPIAAAGSPVVYPSLSQVIKLALNDYVELWGWGNGAAANWQFNPNTTVSNFTITRIS